MKTDPCAMAQLIEARRDGRLRGRELASVERHLASCASCAGLAADLEGLGALLRSNLPVPSPLELQRNRLRLLREAAAPPQAAPRPRPRWPVPAVAMVAAVAALVFWTAQREPVKTTPAAQLPLPAASASARTVTTVAPDGPARFDRRRAGDLEVVSLDDGAVDLSVRPLQPGERFVVKTEDAEVEVRGTVFRVEADAGRIRRVAVSEGKVEVRFRETVSLVLAGASWARPSETTAWAGTDPPASTGSARVAPVAPRASADGRAPASAPRLPRGASAPASKPAPPDGRSDDLAAGIQMIRRGDYGAAAERLDSFSASHPGDDRGEDAAFLAILALQRAGRRADAAAAARRYLARYPSAYRRHEAEAIAAAP